MSSEETIRTTLCYREGTSDKIYEVTLEPKGKGYVVNVAYGRRGGTLKKDTKTPRPIPAYEAGQIHAGLVREKVAKGYKGVDAYGDDGEDEKEPTWDHPKLGRFEHDGTAWTRTVKTPDFKPFRYEGSSTKCE